MLTKLILCCFLLTAMSSASADFYHYKLTRPKAIYNPETARGRYYVGLGLGYDVYRVSRSIVGTKGALTADYNVTAIAPGFLGNFFAGYGYFFNNNFYLGGEVFLNGSSAAEQYNRVLTFDGQSLATRFKFSVGSSFGASILPGFKINRKALFYFRLGYIQARLKQQQNISLNGGNNFKVTKPTWSSGINFGVGLEGVINKVVSARVEYNFDNYDDFVLGPGIKYSAQDNQFVLALIFQVL